MDANRLMADYAKYKLVAPPVDDPLMDAVRALNRGPERLLGEAQELEAQGQSITNLVARSAAHPQK
jgi:hypothetical protein